MAKKAKTKKANPYTKPGLRKRIVSQVKAAATHGTKAGQWSSRKAQLVAKKYNGTIEYIPFPEHLEGKYQTYTRAIPEWVTYKFKTVEDYVKDSLD